mmetsp:Transcript_50759/g.91140  ORF Transcript_50759/g.91140 Transcript_50759/m.91140 type:complete len:118 (+) Transcript_50759:97-450(+)|eukprot:CAMPEP_0197660382 /NCGR_PEP_ID=MMETSP1338-20131121/50814_1 /TAXON_ID=43686 ORGANISM="Pelagodinium beii, Strain RCC1491" /NCGR_SAMPLE_ID=MMETSP1338 /ASSEMBLY_ACC=CAM_ASM_000754 /LENGTH=117 /DNA_ID=CAMNT_0043237719 /DNA_START=90 /DNA_END=443 /DNA_ORIENTATION=+
MASKMLEVITDSHEDEEDEDVFLESRQAEAVQEDKSMQGQQSAMGKKMLLLSPLSTCSTAPPNTPSQPVLGKSAGSCENLDLSWLEDSDDDDIIPGKPLWKISRQNSEVSEELLKLA